MYVLCQVFFLLLFLLSPIWAPVCCLLSAGQTVSLLWSLHSALERKTNSGVLYIMRLFFCLTPPQLIPRSTLQTATATNVESKPINEHSNTRTLASLCIENVLRVRQTHHNEHLQINLFLSCYESSCLQRKRGSALQDTNTFFWDAIHTLRHREKER